MIVEGCERERSENGETGENRAPDREQLDGGAQDETPFEADHSTGADTDGCADSDGSAAPRELGSGRAAAGDFADGEQVLLLDRAGNRRLIRLKTGAKAHGHKGYLEHDRIIGEPEGTAVRSATGTVYVAVRPRLADYALEMPRRTAIVYPKDVGIILVWADIFPGARVFEAGFGSGSLTMALLRAVGPSGRVTVYEQRASFIPAALANICGFDEPRGELVVRQRDAYEGIEERDVDRVVLDIPEPWRVVPHAAVALRLGGIAAFYSPSIIQVQQTVEALESSRAFGQIESLEVLYRPWHVKGQAVRPVQQMVSHTAFLTFARRLKLRLQAPEPGAELNLDGPAAIDADAEFDHAAVDREADAAVDREADAQADERAG